MVIKCYKQILYAFQGRTSAARTLLDSHVNCEISIVESLSVSLLNALELILSCWCVAFLWYFI